MAIKPICGKCSCFAMPVLVKASTLTVILCTEHFPGVFCCTDMATHNQLLHSRWVFSRLCFSNAMAGHVLPFFGENDDRV